MKLQIHSTCILLISELILPLKLKRNWIILLTFHNTWTRRHLHNLNLNVLETENKNSSGHDGISNKLLKLTKNILSKPLTLIINQMITTGIFPDSFKKSKIIPIFKKGDQSLLINYRPISLLPTISEVFEGIIFDQMYHYFNSNNLLAEQQYGFRKNILRTMMQ